MGHTPWNPEALKACLFDFGGTLDSDGITWQDRFYARYRKHGFAVDREAFRLAFYRADDSLTESRALVGAGLQQTLQAQAETVWEALGLNGGSRKMLAIITDFMDGMKWHAERNRPPPRPSRDPIPLGDRFQLLRQPGKGLRGPGNPGSF